VVPFWSPFTTRVSTQGRVFYPPAIPGACVVLYFCSFPKVSKGNIQYASNLRLIACVSVKSRRSFFGGTWVDPILRYTTDLPPFHVSLRHFILRTDRMGDVFAEDAYDTRAAEANLFRVTP
jgi:hypothetical protein